METLNHYSRLLKPSPSVALILKYYQFKSSFRGTRRVINKRSTPVRIYLVLGSLSCRSFAWIPSIIFVGGRSTKAEKKGEHTHVVCLTRKRRGKERNWSCLLNPRYKILDTHRRSAFVRNGSIFMRNHGRGRWLCGHKWVMDDVTISSLSRMDVTISHLRRHGYEPTNGPNKLPCLSVCLSDLSLARQRSRNCVRSINDRLD